MLFCFFCSVHFSSMLTHSVAPDCVRYLLSLRSRAGRTICLLLCVGREGLNGMGWSPRDALSPQEPQWAHKAACGTKTRDQHWSNWSNLLLFGSSASPAASEVCWPPVAPCSIAAQLFGWADSSLVAISFLSCTWMLFKYQTSEQQTCKKKQPTNKKKQKKNTHEKSLVLNTCR